ncbi:MAG: transglycosylase domain-containing protein, partial [Acidimicrobiia bacterium]|nr:transglycosylase domain-containing protein [Acidimicrobiia bacterium]
MAKTLFKLLVVLTATIAFSFGCAVALGPVLAPLGDAASSTEEALFLNPLNERSLMFDRFGGLMTAFYAEENRAPVPLEQIPETVTDAIIAVEDENFYQHDGVNLRATIRALFENVSAGGIEQGGSTITQQVVKNSILTNERSLERKTREAVLALRLEELLTKDQILERYLNTAYFGSGAYGVQAAAETYWGVNVEQLDWSQGAMLAALIRNPNGYNPITDAELAGERRDLALDRVVEVGHLTEAEAAPHRVQPLPTAILRTTPPPNTYFIEQVKLRLLRDPRFGIGMTPEERYEAVFYGGLRIYTTFDHGMQVAAEVARDQVLPGDVAGEFPFLGRVRLPDGAQDTRDLIGSSVVVTLDNATGAVRTHVGGPGFDSYEFDIATAPEGRQAGSAFKPFVLAAAFEAGLVPDDSISGRGICRFNNPGGVPDPYEVENFDGRGGGSGTLASQTRVSSNCAYVRLGQVVGLDNVVELAERLHITTPLEAANMSMPLGAPEMVPMEMVAAYAALANDGIYNAPYYIERVDDAAGNVLYQHTPAGERAVTTQTARMMTEVLVSNVQSGTGTRAQVEGQQAGGKTGTAQNSADAWFVGFTPQFSTAVWMGGVRDPNDPAFVPGQAAMIDVGGITPTGGSYPARIWGGYMNAVLAGAEPAVFPEPGPTRAGRSLTPPRGVEVEVRGG